MKKFLTIALAVFIGVQLSTPVFALDVVLPTQAQKVQDLLEAIKETKDTIQNDKKEARAEIKDLKNEAKELKKLVKPVAAKNLNGTVMAKDGSNLTVEKDGNSYTVQTDSKTQFRRHFWGKSSLAETSVGDKVNVYGKYIDEGKTTILARMIRNLSVMKRFGAFIGTVADLNGSTFTLNTVARGAQKVTLNNSTKCVNRTEQTMNCSDVQNSHKVRVKGVWDKTNSAITEIQHLKDYSLPLK